MNSLLDYLGKTATAISERVIADKLDYQRDKRALQLAQAAAPAPVTVSPTPLLRRQWLIPAGIVAGVILFLALRRKK